MCVCVCVCVCVCFNNYGARVCAFRRSVCLDQNGYLMVLFVHCYLGHKFKSRDEALYHGKWQAT